MELILAGSGSELYNMKLYSALGKERAEELITGSHGSTIVNPEEYNIALDNASLKAAYLREMDNRDMVIGSNNWVISGNKTVSGKPILANDPHLSNVFPSYFYQLRMKAGDMELSGNTIAGAPFIVIGNNKNVAWGVTNVGTDVIDYFLLEPVPGKDGHYMLDGKATAFTVLEKRIPVKGEEDYIHKVRVSAFGPVMESGGKLLARHSINEYPSTVLESLCQLNFAKNSQEIIKALGKWSSPAQNFIFADREGTIGYYPSGLVPLRAWGDGSLPTPGDSIQNLWRGFYREEEKPVVLNPRKGFIVTANNRVIPEGKLPLFAKNWYPSFRADRITELLIKKEKVGVEDNMEYQTDSFLKSAQFLLKIIVDLKPASQGAARMLGIMRNWDLRADSGTAPLIFYRFEEHLAEEIFADELDDELRSLVSRSWIYRLLNYPQGRYDTGALNRWADDKATEEKEVFPDMVARALERTDGDFTKWSEAGNTAWADVHTLTYTHPLGSVFPLKYFLNRGPYAVRGGRDCVMTSTFGNRDKFKVVHLSTFRMILDLGNPENSRMVNSSGQSGHFMSRFYDDQIRLYVEEKYRKFKNPPEKAYTIRLVPLPPSSQIQQNK